jgi:hypothetical protein
LEEVLGEAIPAEAPPFQPSAEGKVEVKLIISNMQQLLQDVKTLFRNNWKLLVGILVLMLFLSNYRDIKRGFMDGLDNNTIAVSTINCGSERECDIEVVKMDANGKILWKKMLGGTSYDKAGSVTSIPGGGYLVVGSTSSFGSGNYDILLTRMSSNGDIIWKKTFGGFLNEYGLQVSLLDQEDVFEIRGTQQVCSTPNVSDQCRDETWTFRVDLNGKKIG